jgi:hypothetical protein
MIEQILLVTGALVWAFIGVTVLLWFPVAVFLTATWVAHTAEVYWLRNKFYSLTMAYTKRVISPIFDPLIEALPN